MTGLKVRVWDRVFGHEERLPVPVCGFGLAQGGFVAEDWAPEPPPLPAEVLAERIRMECEEASVRERQFDLCVIGPGPVKRSYGIPIRKKPLHLEKGPHNKMPFDAEGFENEANSERPSKYGGGSRSPFVAPYQCEDGQYLVRLLPEHGERCKKGFGRSSSHTVETQVGAKLLRFPCTLKSADGCFGCEVLEKLEQVISQLHSDYKTVAQQLDPWVRYMFPAIMSVEATGATDKDDPKFKSTVSTSRTQQVVIFQINASTDALKRKLIDILKDNPDITNHQTGNYLKFVKSGNKYDITPITKSYPIPLPEDEWRNAYPNIDKLCTAGEMSYAKQQSLIEGSWWWKGFQKVADAYVAASDDDDALLASLLGGD